jgi:hypothetical protein
MEFSCDLVSHETSTKGGHPKGWYCETSDVTDDVEPDKAPQGFFHYLMADARFSYFRHA